MTTPTRSDWMLYGVYGRTGRLIIDEARRRGHRPTLAGRDGAQLSALGQATGLHTVQLPLDDGAALRAAAGQCVAAALETGEGYRAAAVAAVGALELQLDEPRLGALTPVQAFGTDFALLVPHTRIQELSRP